MAQHPTIPVVTPPAFYRVRYETGDSLRITRPGTETPPRAAQNDPSPATCHGCIHNAYRGPAGVLPETEAPADDGVYLCRLFSERRPADETPTPMMSACKETRP